MNSGSLPESLPGVEGRRTVGLPAKRGSSPTSLVLLVNCSKESPREEEGSPGCQTVRVCRLREKSRDEPRKFLRSAVASL